MGRDQLRYLGVLAAAAACYAALGCVLPLLAPYLTDRAHVGGAVVGLAVGAPAITGVLARPTGGRLADRCGPAPLVLAGAAVMALGALPLVGPPPGPALVVGSRLAVGIGEGMLMSATTLWLLRLAGPERRGRALGHVGLANYLGLAAGPLVAAGLGGARHPRSVFVAAALIPLAGLALAAPVAFGDRDRALRGGSAAAGGSVDALRRVAGPGAGLTLVNVGYVALLSFGAAAASAHHAGGADAVVPTFAAVVVVVRTVFGSAPDRLGARRTLFGAALAEAAGLLVVARAGSLGLLVGGTVLLAAGQALAVPALGLLALGRFSPDRHGAAAGAFFAFFDLGVGVGGPSVGLAADAGGPPAALLAAAAGVVLVAAGALGPAARRGVGNRAIRVTRQVSGNLPGLTGKENP